MVAGSVAVEPDASDLGGLYVTVLASVLSS